VNATATSGLAVGVSILSGPATIAGNTVHITGAGTVTVRASQGGDGNYNAAVDVDRSFDVLDKTPPAVSAAAMPSIIWPPNKNMVAIALAVSAIDAVDPAPHCAVVDVTGDDGATPADWEIVGPASVRLRAERTGQGSGRSYEIVVKCVDGSGNAATAVASVKVPHDQRK
jgi:hypothetical protein